MIRGDEVYELTMARRELARKLRDTTAALEDCRRALAMLDEVMEALDVVEGLVVWD